MIKATKKKIALFCENDVMWNRWQEALKRGRSGSVKATESSVGIQLRTELVDMIPEFTEEEEAALEGRGAVLTADQILGADSHAYLSIEAIAARASGGDYLSIGDLSGALINAAGTYLDMDGLSAVASGAGFQLANADTYIALENLPWSDATTNDGGYLDLGTMQKLVNAEGDTYLSIEQVQKTLGTSNHAATEDVYLSIADACWWMAKNRGMNPEKLPPASRTRTAAQVAATPVRGKIWISGNGEVLSGSDSIKLCHENGCGSMCYTIKFGLFTVFNRSYMTDAS